MTEAEMASASWCMSDNCPSAICNGPHREVETDLGIETLRYDQEATGTPKAASLTSDQAVEVYRTTCGRCDAVPFYSIWQPRDDNVQCQGATVEAVACKRHLSLILTEDVDHRWDPNEVHLWFWGEEARRDEMQFPLRPAKQRGRREVPDV